MLKKFILAAAMATATILSAPAANADTLESCMLRNGCFFQMVTNEDGSVSGYWVCRTLAVYALCDADEGPYPGSGMVKALQAFAKD